MKPFARRILDFFFLRLSLETASGVLAAYIGAHWLFWRTFDLPPYRLMAEYARAVHMSGELLWGTPLVSLGALQVVSAWTGSLSLRRIACRVLATYMLFVVAVMLITLPRSILGWLVLIGAYGQLSVYFQLPGAPGKDDAETRLLSFAPWPLLLAAGDIDTTTAYIFGAAMIFALGLVPSINIVLGWVRGDKDKDPRGTAQQPIAVLPPNPLMIQQQPVFATLEVVQKVDQELKGSLARLDQYVHESLHAHAKEIQGVALLIKASDEEHRDAVAGLDARGEERIGKVHDRLNVLDRAIGALTQSTQTNDAHAAEVRQTLNVILQRLPRTGGRA